MGKVPNWQFSSNFGRLERLYFLANVILLLSSHNIKYYINLYRWVTRNIVAVLPKDSNSSNFAEIEILKIIVNDNEQNSLNKKRMTLRHRSLESEDTASEAIIIDLVSQLWSAPSVNSYHLKNSNYYEKLT